MIIVAKNNFDPLILIPSISTFDLFKITFSSLNLGTDITAVDFQLPDLLIFAMQLSKLSYPDDWYIFKPFVNSIPWNDFCGYVVSSDCFMK